MSQSKPENQGACESKETCSISKENANQFSDIKKVIAVLSGKGGVGKSLVTSLLASSMRREGLNIGILDADITGPSIPKMFGIDKKGEVGEYGIIPEKSQKGIKIVSINMFLEKQDSPVIWRGPILSNTVKQFWTDTVWGELDYLFIDMPPGTGDVPLTVFQLIPLDGIVIVTSPQDLVNLIVRKSYNMAKEMNIPVIGIVENMSYIQCPDCNKTIDVFGKSRTEEIAQDFGINLIARLPIDPKIAALADIGKIEDYDKRYFRDLSI